MKTASMASNVIHHTSGSRFTWSHENSSPTKAREEYLKNSQVKHVEHLEANKLQRENSKLHEISKRSVVHNKFLKSRFKRHSQQSKPSRSFANPAGRGRRENTLKGRHKRNIIDSTSKDLSAFKGPMRISLLIDGLPPSRKDPSKRETKSVKAEEAAAWSEGKKDQVQTYNLEENSIYPEKNLVLGEGKGLLTAKETAAAESLDLTRYVEETQQPHVNIRRKRVYDILDRLFPTRYKRQIQPQNFDRKPYDSGTHKSGADKKGRGTLLSLPMFGYSYNRVEDDSALNAKFLFV